MYIIIIYNNKNTKHKQHTMYNKLKGGDNMTNAIIPASQEIQPGKVNIIEIYLASIDVKPKTKETYRRALKRFMEWLSDNSLVQPSRADILAYKGYLLDNFTACTVSSYLTAVKGFYIYLEAEKISPNVANGIKGAKHQQGFKKDPLTVEQAKNVLIEIDTKDITGLRDYAIINLLIRTGLRTIEIERANIEDIRQQAGEALLYIQGKGRDSKDDFVLLTESTLKPIRDYIKARGKTKPTDPLFTSHSNKNYGGRLTTRSISRLVKNHLKNSGIDSDRITAHSLRHTAVTLSLIGGATIQEAQSMARHKNINTTLIYAHNINRIKQAPERRIDSLLSL